MEHFIILIVTGFASNLLPGVERPIPALTDKGTLTGKGRVWGTVVPTQMHRVHLGFLRSPSDLIFSRSVTERIKISK